MSSSARTHETYSVLLMTRCFEFLLRYRPLQKTAHSPTAWNVIRPTHGADLKLPSACKCTGRADMEGCGWDTGLQSKEGGHCAHTTWKRLQIQHKEVVRTLNIASSYKFKVGQNIPKLKFFGACAWDELLMNLPPSQTFCDLGFSRVPRQESGLILPNTCQLA